MERPLYFEHLNYRDFSDPIRFAESFRTLILDLKSLLPQMREIGKAIDDDLAGYETPEASHQSFAHAFAEQSGDLVGLLYLIGHNGIN